MGSAQRTQTVPLHSMPPGVTVQTSAQQSPAAVAPPEPRNCIVPSSADFRSAEHPDWLEIPSRKIGVLSARHWFFEDDHWMSRGACASCPSGPPQPDARDATMPTAAATANQDFFMWFLRVGAVHQGPNPRWRK